MFFFCDFFVSAEKVKGFRKVVAFPLERELVQRFSSSCHYSITVAGQTTRIGPKDSSYRVVAPLKPLAMFEDFSGLCA